MSDKTSPELRPLIIALAKLELARDGVLPLIDVQALKLEVVEAFAAYLAAEPSSVDLDDVSLGPLHAREPSAVLKAAGDAIADAGRRVGVPLSRREP